MTDKLEIVTQFTVGSNTLPPIGGILQPEPAPNDTLPRLEAAWWMYVQTSARDYDWETMRALLYRLTSDEVPHLKAGDKRNFLTHHNDTRYILNIIVRKYQQQKEQKKEDTFMGWVKEMLFGRTVIRRSPEDTHVHTGAKSDLDKPPYEPSYQRAFFDKLVAEWQIANGETNPVDAEVDAKVVVIGKSAYLLRGAAANTPDEVLWVFLSAAWSDCVHQEYATASTREKTLTRGIKVCQARDDHGMYTDDKMVLAQFIPVSNNYYHTTMLPSLGGHKEQSRNVELDIKVGPMLMDRLSKLFSLGEVLGVADRDVTNTNALLVLGYKVESGPHDTINQVFTRLSKIK